VGVLESSNYSDTMSGRSNGQTATRLIWCCPNVMHRTLTVSGEKLTATDS
jgi:hypothetical protein